MIEVRNQTELDDAIANLPDETIWCVGGGRFTVSGSSTVWAYDSATVRASDSATVRAYGSATVRASKFVAVHQHSNNATIAGGVVIRVPEITTAEQWCEYRGVPVRDDGTVVLFKAVDGKWKSGRGFAYAPGSTPEAPDWDPVPECGGGLHFVARPHEGLSFFPDATRFVACPVRLDEIVVHPNPAHPSKVKAPRVVAPCWEVDIDGVEVTR